MSSLKELRACAQRVLADRPGLTCSGVEVYVTDEGDTGFRVYVARDFSIVPPEKYLSHDYFENLVGEWLASKNWPGVEVVTEW